MIRHLHLYLYGPDRGPIPTTFDAVAARLCQLDRLYFEPDGSFGWSPSSKERLFGSVYDAHDQVRYIELRGDCRRESWNQLVWAIHGSEVAFGCDEVEKWTVMCLHAREMKELQLFEEMTWKSV